MTRYALGVGQFLLLGAGALAAGAWLLPRLIERALSTKVPEHIAAAIVSEEALLEIEDYANTEVEW